MRRDVVELVALIRLRRRGAHEEAWFLGPPRRERMESLEEIDRLMREPSRRTL